MSGRKRFFADSIDFKTNTAQITGDEFVHARSVQRVEVGSEISILDGSGKQFRAIVSAVYKTSLSAHIISSDESCAEPKADIFLAIGALKGDKTELAVQKACELGVSKIAVFSSEFCSAYINDNKLERLKKVAREAAKQCMRSSVPQIYYFDTLEKALDFAADYKNKLFACEFALQSDIKLDTIKGSAALVVGSEGGFSQSEFALAKSKGYSAVYLGKRILRAETAAIALTAICAYFLGELQ